MVMILTVLILPPTALLIMTSVVDPPFEQQFEGRLQERLANGDITQEEYDDIKQKFGNGRPPKFLHPPQLMILVISLVWLGIGIRQWIVLSKWDKKYQQFKAQQDEINKELDDEPDDDPNES